MIQTNFNCSQQDLLRLNWTFVCSFLKNIPVNWSFVFIIFFSTMTFSLLTFWVLTKLPLKNKKGCPNWTAFFTY